MRIYKTSEQLGAAMMRKIEMQKNEIKVFVYGTLMNSRSNHSYIKEQKLIGEARLDDYEMYNVRSYPGIVPKGGEYILGELYEVSSEVLKRLDKLEGEGYLYRRITAKVRVNSEEYEAYAYIWLGSTEGCRKVTVKEMPWKPVRVRCEE